MHFDLLKGAWILVTFFFIFFWLPARMRLGQRSAFPPLTLARGLLRTVLCVVVAVFVLASIRALGALPLLCLAAGALAFPWLRAHSWMSRNMVLDLQARSLHLLRAIEFSPAVLEVVRRVGRRFVAGLLGKVRLRKWLGVLCSHGAPVLLVAVVVAVTCIVRYGHALRELRFDQPDQYVALLRARELLLNLHAPGRPLVFPSVIAATSLLSETDPMEVARFVAPLAGVFVVAALGLLTGALTRLGIPALAAMYCLGAHAFPPVVAASRWSPSFWHKVLPVIEGSPAVARASTEFEFGLLFLLLGLVFLADWRRSSSWNSLLDVACCLVLVAVSAALLIRPLLALPACVALCYGGAMLLTWAGAGLDNDAPMIMPVASAILAGCGVALVEAMAIQAMGKAGQAVVLAACFAIAIAWLQPNPGGGQYLEYDTAARKALEIAYKFPRLTWRAVAPVEQLAETLGAGSYEDLAGFVDKYETQVARPDFRFSSPRQDLFIFVEKRPFQMFSTEPSSVLFPVLTDATYRSYRSPAGRASLEAAALQLCETYRRNNPDTEVYFEDENLRIYHIGQRETDMNRATLVSSATGP